MRYTTEFVGSLVGGADHAIPETAQDHRDVALTLLGARHTADNVTAAQVHATLAHSLELAALRAGLADLVQVKTEPVRERSWRTALRRIVRREGSGQ